MKTVRAFGATFLAENPPFRIAVTGSRWLDLGDRAVMELRNLLSQLSTCGDVSLLHGGATGVDSSAAAAAKALSVPALEFIADWNRHGNAAGPIRNREMVLRATHLIAFPGGKGTANCVRVAREYPHCTVLEVGR